MLGSTDLPLRRAEHAAGCDARLTEAVAVAGITWTLACLHLVEKDPLGRAEDQGPGRGCTPLPTVRHPTRRPPIRQIIALPQWTEVIENGGYRLVANCEICK